MSKEYYEEFEDELKLDDENYDYLKFQSIMHNFDVTINKNDLLLSHVNNIAEDYVNDGWEIVEVKGFFTAGNPTCEFIFKRLKENE